MTHLSFDCPKNLRIAFNHESKANGNSVCKLLQQYMSAYVSASMVKKNALGNMNFGVSKKETVVNVGINALNFTQNVQNRPRRLVNCNPDAVIVDNRCMIGTCRKPSVDVMLYQNKEYRVCSFHSAEYSKCKDWSFVK